MALLPEQREDRREKVKELWFIRRYPIKQIAQQLHTGKLTILKDIKIIREEIAKDVKDDTLKKFLADTTLRHEKIVNKSWLEYERADKSYVRIEALKIIQDAEMHYLDILERLGLILPPIQRSININAEVDLKTLEEEYSKKMQTWMDKKKVLDVTAETKEQAQ